MGDEGLEPTTDFSKKTAISAEGGAKSGALFPHPSESDPDLAKLLAAWPTLDTETKAMLLHMVELANGSITAKDPTGLISQEIEDAIEDALENAPGALGYWESFWNWYGTPTYGPNDGPCDGWTNGVLEHLRNAKLPPNVQIIEVEWQIYNGVVWTGHHGIRIEVYDPATGELIEVIYVDNGTIGGDDNIFGSNDIPDTYHSEDPGCYRNGTPAPHSYPHQGPIWGSPWDSGAGPGAF